MLKLNNKFIFIVLFLGASFSNVSAEEESQEIMTLFTTQKERALIDKNRYSQQTKTVKSPAVVKEEPVVERKVIHKQETITIKVSGITITQDGKNMAWVNGAAYENGGKLEDGSQVFISRNNKKSAQIKTPDGKYHSVATGETTELSYLKPVEE